MTPFVVAYLLVGFLAVLARRAAISNLEGFEAFFEIMCFWVAWPLILVFHGVRSIIFGDL